MLQWLTTTQAGRLLLTEARAVTGRKLYLRVMPELTLTGYTCRRHRICTGVGEEKPIFPTAFRISGLSFRSSKRTISLDMILGSSL